MREHLNRNAIRSKRLIRDAFVSLVSERGRSRISVTDVCRRADLNRATFYAHYESFEDLELSLYEDYLEGIAAWYQDARGHDFLSDPLPALEKLGCYLEQNMDVLKALMAHSSSNDTGYGFGMAVRKALLQVAGDDRRDLSWMVRFDFVSSALTSTYFTWAVGSYGELGVHELNVQLAAYVRSCAPEG